MVLRQSEVAGGRNRATPSRRLCLRPQGRRVVPPCRRRQDTDQRAIRPSPDRLPVLRQVLGAGRRRVRGKASSQGSQHLSSRGSVDLQRVRCPDGADTRRGAPKPSPAPKVAGMDTRRPHATVGSAGATAGPHPGHERPDRNGQHRSSAVRHPPSSPARIGHPPQVATTTRRSLAQRKCSLRPAWGVDTCGGRPRAGSDTTVTREPASPSTQADPAGFRLRCSWRSCRSWSGPATERIVVRAPERRAHTLHDPSQTQGRQHRPAPAGTSSSIVSQDEKPLGMIVLMARCTASTNVVSPGAAWGERRPSRQEAGHRGAGRSRGVYEEIRTPWRHATIHLRAPYLPSERVGPTLAVAERIS